MKTKICQNLRQYRIPKITQNLRNYKKQIFFHNVFLENQKELQKTRKLNLN